MSSPPPRPPQSCSSLVSSPPLSHSGTRCSSPEEKEQGSGLRPCPEFTTVTACSVSKVKLKPVFKQNNFFLHHSKQQLILIWTQVSVWLVPILIFWTDKDCSYVTTVN